MTQPAAPDSSGSTSEISIDNQTFTIPAGAVPAFLATREMTIASFRRVTEGRAGARDMAFVFGTAAETTPEHSSQNALTRIDSRAGTLTSAVPRRRAEDDAAPAAPITAPTAATTRTLLKLDSASLNSRNTFLGDFHDFEHAQRELGMNKSWCRGKYIDGLLSLGWGFAETRELVGMDRCKSCLLLSERTGVYMSCWVVDEPDMWIWMLKNRCGLCVQTGAVCSLNVDPNTYCK
jgi:hypothetical protein